MPNHQEQELRSLLTEQDFGTTTWEYEILENRKMQVRSFVQIDNGVAVLSDLRKKHELYLCRKFRSKYRDLSKRSNYRLCF